MLIWAYILRRQALYYKAFDSGESFAKSPSNEGHVSSIKGEGATFTSTEGLGNQKIPCS